MKFTNEQLAKVKAAQSAEEILELAKSEGIEMTEEEATTAFTKTHEPSFGELSDEELENVAGGGCSKTYKSADTPAFIVSEVVEVNYYGKYRRAIVEKVTSQRVNNQFQYDLLILDTDYDASVRLPWSEKERAVRIKEELIRKAV